MKGAVAVIGNYGNSSLGDEATLAAIIEQVRRRRVNPKIIALSVDPDDTRTRHGLSGAPVGCGHRADLDARTLLPRRHAAPETSPRL